MYRHSSIDAINEAGTDQIRRKSLKSMVVGGIATTAALTIPVSIAITAAQQQQPVTQQSVQLESGVSITHYGNPNGHTLLLRNHFDHGVTLKDIAPAMVQTKAGSLDLNLAFGPDGLFIPERSTQAVSISTDGKVRKYARWQHIESNGLAADKNRRQLAVKVNVMHFPQHGEDRERMHVASYS